LFFPPPLGVLRKELKMSDLEKVMILCNAHSEQELLDKIWAFVKERREKEKC
jgi:hypothetical protein